MRRISIRYHWLFALLLMVFACEGCELDWVELPPTSVGGEPEELITVPEGFELRYYTKAVPGARSMALGTNGTVFVGTRSDGVVYAVVDEDGNQTGDTVYIVDEDLNSPNGVAFLDGNLYVAEIGRILRYDDIEQNLANPPEPVILNDDYPKDAHHGWKFIRFSPDNKLYVPIGAPCNVCDEEDERYATITRLDKDGAGFEIFARGIRNSVGFDWHPETGELWFTDNGRDNLGDDKPPDELNRAPEQDLHFGFPYCHGSDLTDPDFGAGKSCSDYVPPVRELGPHVAALGMRFYTGDMFPEEYRNQIFIAEHGSWNSSVPTGYRVTLVRLQGNEAVSYEPFATGWLEDDGQAWGRPVDLLHMPDGALLISDDKAGVLYRLSYVGVGGS